MMEIYKISKKVTINKTGQYQKKKTGTQRKNAGIQVIKSIKSD